jgi:hypothetical protein
LSERHHEQRARHSTRFQARDEGTDDSDRAPPEILSD